MWISMTYWERVKPIFMEEDSSLKSSKLSKFPQIATNEWAIHVRSAKGFNETNLL